MKNDSILPLTRVITAVVVLFLVAAFGILFFLPDRTGELFAWAIKPHMSSMYFGSAYLGGAWILAQTAFGKRWHRFCHGRRDARRQPGGVATPG